MEIIALFHFNQDEEYDGKKKQTWWNNCINASQRSLKVLTTSKYMELKIYLKKAQELNEGFSLKGSKDINIYINYSSTTPNDSMKKTKWKKSFYFQKALQRFEKVYKV